MADRPEEAHQLIELYRTDVIVAVSEAEKRRLPLRTGIAPGSRSRDRLIVERHARSVIGYHHGRRSDLVDVDAEAGGQSRRDTEVDGGLDWNVGSQVRPARHECLQCGRRVIGDGSSASSRR